MNKQDYEQQIQELRNEVELLQKANLDLINRNMQLGQQMDAYYDVRRRIQILKELVIRHKELMRQADMRDDDELMALIEMRVEKDRPHLRPDFNPTALAEMLGVSMTRLYQLFRHQTIHRTPEAYIDNLRTLAALRLLREKPNYTIAVIAEEAGFSNVRTLQRRIQDAIGMSPVDYRLMLTRDL